jgi:hypothetical protein
MRIFDQVREAALNWDGRDPIRMNWPQGKWSSTTAVQAGVASPEAPGQLIVSTGRSARSRNGLCWTWGDRYRDSFERARRPPVYSRVNSIGWTPCHSDDRFRFRPAGTEAWIKSGFLSEGSSLALTHLERQACYFMFSEPAAICQNMFLATEAIGLGGWMHCGILSREIFEALGFTIVEPQEEPGLPNPVGLDRVFQAYVRRVSRAWTRPSTRCSGRSCGGNDAERRPRFSGAIPDFQWRSSQWRGRDQWTGIACTKVVCNYIHQTYGRFPATVDAMHLMWLMQAHHLDTDYYDRFFRPRDGTYASIHFASVDW